METMSFDLLMLSLPINVSHILLTFNINHEYLLSLHLYKPIFIRTDYFKFRLNVLNFLDYLRLDCS